MTRPRGRTAPVVLLTLAGLVAVVGTTVISGFLREYGNTNASGMVQGLSAAVGPAGVVLLLSALAYSSWRSRRVLLVSAALVLAALAGPAIGGQLAVNARQGTYAATPTCSMDGFADKDGGVKVDVDPAVQARLDEFQAAFDGLEHPATFASTFEVGSESCRATLATDDLGAVLSFYRAELPPKGWTISEDAGERLVAASGDLVLTVSSPAPGAEPEVGIRTGPQG